MPLHIIIGFDGPQKTCPPSLVYLGESASASQIAMDASLCRRFVCLRNPLGYGKNNAFCDANRAKALEAAASAKPAAASPAGSILVSPEELEKYRAHLEQLEEKAAAAQNHAAEVALANAELQAEILRLKAAQAATPAPASEPQNSSPTQSGTSESAAPVTPAAAAPSPETSAPAPAGEAAPAAKPAKTGKK